MSEVSNPHFEAQFNMRLRHPERMEVYKGHLARGRTVKARTPSREICYGPHSLNRIELFERPDATAHLVFFHGGYWRTLDKDHCVFLARPFLEAGVEVSLANYGLAPEFPLSGIVDHAQAACRALRRERPNTPLVIAGHSAGAHLAAWGALAVAQDGAPPAGLIGLSGLYDLLPLLQTNVNVELDLDAMEAFAFSPARRPWPKTLGDAAVLLATGGRETLGFKRQTLDFAHRLRAAGVSVHEMEVADRNHFTILDSLADPADPLFKAALAVLRPGNVA
ncbi:MAG: alpha/beta hydrolase [Alphaproteobacteria bacterium]|nr:alpha/beta hydrolase [Alphaproteobacteria bacterium]